MARTNKAKIEKYKNKLQTLVQSLLTTDDNYTDSYRESLINQSVDAMYRLKFLYQGGGK